MKITALHTHVLSTPLDEPFAFSMGWVTRRGTMLVELHTDEGVIGWGESLCHGLQPPQIAAVIVKSALEPIVVGQDPHDVDVLWERMYNLTRPFGQKGSVLNAIAAVDIAIWDALGRAAGKPACKLPLGENEFSKSGTRCAESPARLTVCERLADTGARSA